MTRIRGSIRATALIVAAVAAVAVAGAISVPIGRAAAADNGSSHRARYHFTVPDSWMNDPQRPVYLDGKYNFYYLYNADYTRTVGTSWRLATTTDNVAFQDQGVTVPKTGPNKDVWSGSPVVDDDGTAGFGAGAVVVLATQPDRSSSATSPPQAQFLWYSADRGKTFQRYGDTPVISNTRRNDFRDPKLVRDQQHNRWLAVITEGDRLSIWTSPDLKTRWQRASEFFPQGPVSLECPDLFQIVADDGTLKWVLAASADGTAAGQPHTYAYWVGTLNLGNDTPSFTPDSTTPQWLDYGFDWYAGVTWPDQASPNGDKRFALAWMNNWAYANAESGDKSPTWASDGFEGTTSIVREIRLKTQAGTYHLVSQPVGTLAGRTTTQIDVGTLQVNGQTNLGYHGDAYELDADVSWNQVENIGLQLDRSNDGTRHVDVGIYGDYAYLNRGFTGNPANGAGGYLESRAPFDRQRKSVHLRILVDRTTVEVFLDDGTYVLSSQVFPQTGDTGIQLYANGGSALFANLRIREFKDLGLAPAPQTGAIRFANDARKCVDVDGATSRAQLWDCLGNGNQTWTLGEDGTVRARGACLEAAGGAVDNGTVVRTSNCNGGTHQQWSQTPHGTLINVRSQRCLDLPDGEETNGHQLQLWDCNGGANQRWSYPAAL